MKTLLTFGDKSDWDSYLKFQRTLKKHKNDRVLKPISLNYAKLEKGTLPKVKDSSPLIYLFFPFKYWNKNIEYNRYKGIYGNEEFYKKFRIFWSDIYRKLQSSYPNKHLEFVNHPLEVAAERDKEYTKMNLSEHGLDVPKSYHTRELEDILRLINEEEKKLYLKIRYGSMGKGITYLEKDGWYTNFRFQKKKIECEKSDHGWTFTNITNNPGFLRSS